MTKDLSFRGPLNIAIVEGASSPDPGVYGTSVWSTTANKMLVWSGTWKAADAVVVPNVIISTAAPTASPGVPKLWIQTGLGAGGTGITFWIEDGLP